MSQKPLEVQLGEGWLSELFEDMQEERDFLDHIQKMIHAPFTAEGVLIQKEELQRLLNMVRAYRWE